MPGRPTIDSFSATIAAISSGSFVGVLDHREGDVLLDVHRVEERAALEEHRHAAPDGGEGLLGEAHDRLPEDAHVAVVGLCQAVDVAQRHALSGSRGPEDAEHLAARRIWRLTPARMSLPE